MDGPFYVDTRPPHISADVASVTLAGTLKALIPVANIPALGSNYFSWVGKAMRITLHGRITTGATPGNFTFSLMWGTGIDANGTAVNAACTGALTASQTNNNWRMEMTVRCRSMGTTGTLFCTGYFMIGTTGFFMIPTSAPAASASLDLTAANFLSPQISRSGSTAESMQVHEVIYEAVT